MLVPVFSNLPPIPSFVSRSLEGHHGTLSHLSVISHDLISKHRHCSGCAPIAVWYNSRTESIFTEVLIFIWSTTSAASRGRERKNDYRKRRRKSQRDKPYRLVKPASQALSSIHARRSFARFAGPSKVVLSNTGACRAKSPCPLFIRSRLNPMHRKVSSLRG